MSPKSGNQIGQIFRSKVFFALIVAIFIFSLWSLINEVGRRSKIQSEIDQQKEVIARLENENKDLASLINYLQSSDFVEKEAREKLKLSKPGESLIILDDSQAKLNQEGVNNSVKSKWWTYFFK